MSENNRQWLPLVTEKLIAEVDNELIGLSVDEIESEIFHLIDKNKKIHEVDCINLNPATNVMNPRAEKILASGLGSRPSLGYPGDKYEMGLEAIEKIEIIAANLARDVFQADYAEIRVPSGAIANLYTFMSCCKPGDNIIVPPASIGGHVTHNQLGAAGLYGLNIYEAPVDAKRYTVDIEKLAQLVKIVNPKLISIGSSLNLHPHPIAQIREIADRVNAKVLFDAAHLCGLIAGKSWQQPLQEGAHVMTMSTYKSLGGPPSGLIVSNNSDLAERIEAIAFPGLTANFDVAKSASLAISLLDWKCHGREYGHMMIATAKTLAQELANHDIAIYNAENGFTQSHQFALRAKSYGGGHHLAKHLRKANLLTSGIGLPIEPIENDMNGLRIGTPEIVRWGMGINDMYDLAQLLAKAIYSDDPSQMVDQVREFRANFTDLYYVR